MWRLGDLRSNAKGGKFLSLEPLIWLSSAALEMPWEPSAYSEGQRPTVSFAADDSTREFWARAEDELVERLAAVSERVFCAKLPPEAVRARLLPCVRQSRGGDWLLKAKLPADARFWDAGGAPAASGLAGPQRRARAAAGPQPVADARPVRADFGGHGPSVRGAPPGVPALNRADLAALVGGCEECFKAGKKTRDVHRLVPKNIFERGIF